jgi:hypothetical protein
VSGLERDCHDELIDRFTDDLNRWMKIVDHNNRHKRPISEELDKSLRDGMEEEFGEIEKGFVWVTVFGRNPDVVVGLELGDMCRYALERLRRLGLYRDLERGETGGDVRDPLREKAGGEEIA